MNKILGYKWSKVECNGNQGELRSIDDIHREIVGVVEREVLSGVSTVK